MFHELFFSRPSFFIIHCHTIIRRYITCDKFKKHREIDQESFNVAFPVLNLQSFHICTHTLPLPLQIACYFPASWSWVRHSVWGCKN
jgi:hypothetical protein